MMEFFNNFHFLRPWYLLFLILPFLLYLKKIKNKGVGSSWEDVCDRHLLEFLLIDKKNIKKSSAMRFVYIGLVFASIAVAGPSWKKIEVPSFDIENPNMFVLSLAQDMMLDDITPSRLERAKYMISDLTHSIKQGQFGLEVYSLEPYVISPITEDVNLIKNLLLQVDYNIVPDQGDRLDRAIDLAIKKFQDANYMSGNIILFAADVGQRFDKAIESVEKAKKLNYTVNIIDASYSGNDKLKILADNGNGIYLQLAKNNILPLVDKASNVNDKKAKLSNNLRSSFEDFGYYLLIIPLLIVLSFFRRGFLILFFMVASFNANAGVWLNDNQEGLRFFEQKKYEEALGKFNDKIWRSVVLYKQDKLEDALAEVENKEDEIGLYNKGVILTKLCKYEDAKKVFDKVVELYPNNEDAQYNKKILEDLFVKAKENPKLLSCEDENKDKQQQNSPQEQKQKQNKDDEKNSSDDNKNQKQSEEEQENKQNKDNKEENAQQDDKQNPQNDENKDDKKNNEDKDGEKSDSKKENAEQQNEEQDNANDDKNDSKSKDGNNEDNNSKDKQKREEQVDAPLVNAKKTNKDEDFDEEALIMQRRYREIPEDTGGLLREFIKKEYMKDRYKNENI